MSAPSALAVQPVARPRGLCLILKVTDACNARCRFCSVGEARGARLDDARLERLTRQLSRLVQARHLERLTVALHGGEPTLLGADFLDRACEALRTVAPVVEFNMQTNLLNWDEPLTRLVERQRIRLGTSVDPLTRQRTAAGGEDSYPRWLETFLTLAGRGLAPGAIFVVTTAALGRERELVRFAQGLSTLVGKGVGLQVNPLYPQGRARQLDLVPTPEQFGAFLVTVYRHWVEAGCPFPLTPMRQLVDALGPNPCSSLSCSFLGQCADTHLGIDGALNVAGCGRRLDSQAFYGNLSRQDLIEILEEAQERQSVRGRASALYAGACAECRYWSVCHGGCPDDASLRQGSVRERSHFCESYRALFTAIEAAPPPRERVRKPRPPARPARAEGSCSGQPAGPREIVVSRDPGQVTGAGRDVWLVADDPRIFRYDSPLAPPSEGFLRIWLHNAHAARLTLFEDLARSARVEFVLHEAAGIVDAAQLLNGLRARIALDVRGLLTEPEGAEALLGLLQRFLTDPSWASPIQPFADLLRCALEPARTTGYRSRTGDWVRLGRRISGDPALTPAFVDPPLEPARSLVPWLLERASCLSCEEFRLCGGVVYVGGQCSSAGRCLIDRVHQAAAEIRSALAPSATDPPPGGGPAGAGAGAPI